MTIEGKGKNSDINTGRWIGFTFYYLAFRNRQSQKMCMSTFPTEFKTRFYLIYFRLCLFPLLFSALKPGFKKSYRNVLKSWCSNSKYQAVKVHSAEVFL